MGNEGEKITSPDPCGAWHLTWAFPCLCFSEQAWGDGSYCFRPILQKGLKSGKWEPRLLHLAPKSLGAGGSGAAVTSWSEGWAMQGG